MLAPDSVLVHLQQSYLIRTAPGLRGQSLAHLHLSVSRRSDLAWLELAELWIVLSFCPWQLNVGPSSETLINATPASWRATGNISTACSSPCRSYPLAAYVSTRSQVSPQSPTHDSTSKTSKIRLQIILTISSKRTYKACPPWWSPRFEC